MSGGDNYTIEDEMLIAADHHPPAIAAIFRDASKTIKLLRAQVRERDEFLTSLAVAMGYPEGTPILFPEKTNK